MGILSFCVYDVRPEAFKGDIITQTNTAPIKEPGSDLDTHHTNIKSLKAGKAGLEVAKYCLFVLFVCLF